ncbi:hypothetical protein JOF56_001033 [Kibdelosporangium banguiense]|uniref:DUF397 domain-containing protein n=1 Tax=Kibdelosporangium banguiense TaxID=1365924 RepID=A0ABS4T9U8_9PSEU|nr:DUF397 domain-containing protein [Kibdelosporangium banguiense]MBP2320648.1 hypothetical protein [Kibdelosporangium banguiense]
MSSLDPLEWRTSSYSANSANCVEVAMPADVLVRDSKAPEDGYLVVPSGSWAQFLTRMTSGFHG